MRPGLVIAGSMAFLAMAGGVFLLKNTVEDQRERLRAVEAQIRKDRQAVDILRTEWTHLSSPARIQTLTDKHLALQPLAPAQIIESPAQIPPRAGRMLAAAPPEILSRKAEAAPVESPDISGESDFAARMRAAITAQESDR